MDQKASTESDLLGLPDPHSRHSTPPEYCHQPHHGSPPRIHCQRCFPIFIIDPGNPEDSHYLHEDECCEHEAETLDRRQNPRHRFDDFEFTGAMLRRLKELQYTTSDVSVMADVLREEFGEPMISRERVAHEFAYLPCRETAKFLRRDYNLHDPEHSPFEYFPEHQYLKELYTGGFLYEEIPAIVSQFQYKDVFAWDVYEKIAELKMTEELEAREGIPAPKPEVSINGQESEKVGALGVAM